MRRKSVWSVLALLSLGILLAVGIAHLVHPAQVVKAPQPVKLAQPETLPPHAAATLIPRREKRLRAPGAELENEEERKRPDNPGEAVTFRRLSLRDEHGNIDPDGLVKAKAHADIMRTEAKRRASMRVSPDAAGIDSTSWSWLGPGNVGGRVRSIVVDPTNPNLWIIGSVGGGIWKTTNAGGTWAPLNDFMANLAVSALVMQPGTPSTIYAGTGEGFYNLDSIQGAGIFKSTDGGATWNQLASTANQAFYEVNRLCMPSSSVLLAATRDGIHRSADAGATFKLALSLADGQGALDLGCHPTDPTKAVASDGAGHAYYSTDGGSTWTKATGFPTVGRIEVAYANSSPTTVYAVADETINKANGTFYKSTNGGASYTRISTPGHLNGQGWYSNALWVDPTNANLIVVGGLDIWRSTDGGVSWSQISDWSRQYNVYPPDSPHADHHAIVSLPNFDGNKVKTVLFGNDGGIYSTADIYAAGNNSLKTSGWVFQNHNLGITQFYGAAGNATTGTIIAGAQDNGTITYTTAGGPQGYTMMNGGDGGFAAADPKDPNYFYGEYVYLQLCRSTDGGKTAGDIYTGIAEAGKKANFIAPFLLDPNNPNTLLGGASSLWRSTNIKAATPSWAAIKPPANDYISAIAVGQGNSDLCWVGHNDGAVYKTTNCTAASPKWTEVDTNVPGLPSRYIARITIDPNDANSVYVSLGGYSTNNLWRTKDAGATWAAVSGSGQNSLPPAPVRDLAIAPGNSKTLYAASDLGVFTSTDQGATWTVPQDGPANVAVDQLFWMGPKLVAATHGRGLYLATPNSSAGDTCTAVSTGKTPTSAPPPDPLPTSVPPGPEVRTTPSVSPSFANDQLPPGGVWARKVKADGKGETWSYNFTIPEGPPQAGTSASARRDRPQTVVPSRSPDAAGGSGSGGSMVNTAAVPTIASTPPATVGGVVSAPRTNATAVKPALAASPGAASAPGRQLGSAPATSPRPAATPAQAGAPRMRKAPHSTKPASAPSGSETAIPAETPDAASPGNLVQRRFVQAADPRQPASAGNAGWYEYWFDPPPAAHTQREIAALNPSGQAGWVKIERSAPGADLLRARGIPYRRVVPTPLAGVPAAGSAMTAEAGVPLAGAHLASAFPLAKSSSDGPGVSAFDINLEDQGQHRQASSVRFHMLLTHPHLDQITVWLAAGGREVVLWDGRGGSDDGGFDDDAENDSNITLDRVLNTELSGAPLAGHWTLYVSNADAKATGSLDQFWLQATPEPRASRLDSANVFRRDDSPVLDVAAQRAYLLTEAGGGAEVTAPALGQSVHFTLDWTIAGTGRPVALGGRALLDGAVFCSGSAELGAGSWTTWCDNAWVVQAGTHTLQWDLDSANTIAETDKSNNTAIASLASAGPGATDQRAYLRTAPPGSGSEIGAPAVGQAIYFTTDWQVTGTTDPVTISRRAVLDGVDFCTGSSAVTAGRWTSWCTDAWKATAGSHTLRWDIDYTNQLAGTAQANNSVTVVVNATSLDIAAMYAYLQPDALDGTEVPTPLVGQTVYLTVDYLVSGTSSPLVFSMRALLDGATYCTLNESVPNDGWWYEWCAKGWVATAGTHTLEWDLNYDNAVKETDYSNNTVSADISTASGDIIANRAFLRTDFNDAKSEVTTPAVGQSVYVMVDLSITGSGPIDVPVMAVVDGSIVCYGTVTGETVGDHVIGCKSAWVVTPGTHTLDWYLNYDFSVPETDYDNDDAEAVFTAAGVDIIAQRAYLTVSSGGTEVTAPTVGQSVFLTMDWSIAGASGTLSVPVRATLDGVTKCSGSISHPSGNFWVSCTNAWVVTAGTHTLEWDVNYDNSIVETNVNNNSAVKTFSDASLDLVANRAYLRTMAAGQGAEVDAPAVGQAVYFTFDWQVNGAGASIVVPQRAVIDGSTFCSFSPTATPGTSWTSWCSSPWTATAGDHTLQWDLDFGNTLPDSNRSNNSAKKAFTAGTGAPTLDLAAVRSYLRTDVSGGGSEVAQPVVGQTVYFYLDWQVTGTGNPVAVTQRAMFDGTQYCGGTSTVGPPTNWSTWCNTGWVATAGAHTLRWDLDYANAIAETNENNNSATVTFTPAASGATLDLVAVRAYMQTAATGGTEVATPTVGQTVYFFLDWQIAGTGANVTVAERAMLDGVQYCTNGDTAGPGNWTSYCTKAWTATAGSHTLNWDLDYNNTIAETNENNNSATKTFTPGVPLAGVDLAALKAYLRTAAGGGGTEVDPPTLAQKIYPSLDWQVTGSSPALNVTQRAVLDSTTLCSCSTTANVGTSYVSSCSQSYSVPAGAHTLRWDLDYGNTISETNKTNNSVTKNFTPPSAGSPGLAIVKTHTGNFTRGQNGAYSVTVTNIAGGGTVTGTVTVTDTLPTGLTLVSMAGTGWTCTTNTCTRGDALAAGASYPKITVTVNVAANADASVTNQVSVSGGGSAASDALDPTTIVNSSSGPSIAAGGVVNGASFLAPVAANGFVTIYGQNFSTTTASWDSAIPDGKTLPIQLGSVSVTINGKNAFVNYVSPGQLNVLSPPDTTVGPVPVVVTTPQGTASATVSMDQISPGFFAYNLNGKLYPSAVFANTAVYVAAVGALSSTSRPAKPGDIIQLYATGLGATQTPVPAGQVLTTNYPIADLTQVKATIGGIPAPVSYAGMTFAGVFQVNVQVPPGITAGDLPVVLSVGAKSTQPNTVLTFLAK